MFHVRGAESENRLSTPRNLPRGFASTNKELQEDFRGNLKERDLFGKGVFCLRKDFQQHGVNLQCGSCRLSVDGLTGEGLVAGEHEPCNMGAEEIQKKLYLLRSATGQSQKIPDPIPEATRCASKNHSGSCEVSLHGV